MPKPNKDNVLENSPQNLLSLELQNLNSTVCELRRYLHSHPEPSGQEFKTTTYLADLLEKEGLEFRLGKEGRGLIVDSDAEIGRPKPALRADIDALRLQDEKTVTYRSTEQNLMHACGHDAHTAMAFGATLALHRLNKKLDQPIRWRSIFQPEEESAQGALNMIEVGALHGIDQIIALHVDPFYEVGEIGICDGVLTACCEEFEFTIHGQGGHGARPHNTKDPIHAATHLVQSIYAQVPRMLDARDPTVVSVGVIEAGVNPNVIPDKAYIRGTIRSIEPGQTDRIHHCLRKVAMGIEEMTGTRIEFSIAYSLPSVKNDPGLLKHMIQASQEIPCAANLKEIKRPSMGGEDFAFYLEQVPGCMCRLGIRAQGQPIHHLHSTLFDIDERALPLGTSLLAHSILRINLPR